MKESKNRIATCRNFRQVVVVRFFRTTTNGNSVVRDFRTTQKLQHWVRSAYLFGVDEIVYAVRTQLRHIARILNPSNSIGLDNKRLIINTLNHG